MDKVLSEERASSNSLELMKWVEIFRVGFFLNFWWVWQGGFPGGFDGWEFSGWKFSRGEFS